MGKSRAIPMFLVAVVLASGAVWMANNWIKSRLEPKESKVEKGDDVVVAAVDIAFGQKIEDAHLRLVKMPKGTAPKSVFHKTDDALGKVANQKIFAGEILIADRLTGHGEGSALAAVITPGMRAVTVRVNDVIGVAGFLLPGNRVDVIASKKHGHGVTSKTMLQNVKVLAVDQTASTDKNKPVIVRAVTLELSPEFGERLVKATKEGSVQLALRNPQEQTIRDLEEKPEPKVVEAPKPKPAELPRAPRKRYVTVIRGTNVAQASIP